MDNLDTLDDILQEGEISQTVKEHSANTATWVKIVAIVSIATSVLSLTTAFIYNTNIIGGVIGTGITIALYITLLSYGNSLLALANSGKTSDFEEAMDKQKGYWLFLGILVILSIFILLIAMVLIGSNFGFLFDQIMSNAF